MPIKDFVMIFFDFESTQEEEISSSCYKHTPNLCVAHIVCNKCFDVASPSHKCESCKKREHIFENTDSGSCVKQFVDFCDIYRPQTSKVYVVAHNLKGYDGQFILEELVKRDKTIIPIMSGLKVLKITYGDHVVFIDSMSFIPVALQKFSKAFGIPEAKGFFPYKFNTAGNYNYSGKMPDIKYYAVDQMRQSESDAFHKWYNEQVENNFVFNTRNELIKYCATDVQILRLGCTKFISDFQKITDINPFLHAFTLSQAVMFVYRKNFMEERQIGITPNNMYASKVNSSTIAKMWLAYKKKDFTDIEFEVKIPSTKYIVDGFVRASNTVLEFLGCFYHGCPCCFLNRGLSLHNGKETIDSRYQQTQNRLKRLSFLGYNVQTIWECEFKKFLKANPQIDSDLKEKISALEAPLHVRDAIYGGRVETFRLHYKVRPGEKIMYYDFCSLYPYVNKYCKNPIGHPKIFRGQECSKINITQIDGIIKCKILPPNKLTLPVLPYRINKKLMFLLCRTCGEENNFTTNCTHNTEQRSLKGTWVIEEVNLALERGYEILESYEIWQYETAQYDPDTKTGGLFTSYMDTFIRLKTEASGWGPDIETEEQKDSFIKLFYEKEGIHLNKDNMIKNPSVRSVTKQCCNALWGKFIQTTLLGKTTVINSEEELHKMLLTPGICIKDIVCTGEKLWMNWNFIDDEFAEPLPFVSLPIGAFTTANARVKLYRTMEKIQNDILYCDTDSVIFIQKPDSPNPLQTGDFLGDLTDELVDYGKGAYINEFVSTGPKCYAFTVANAENDAVSEVVKCKGFTLSVTNKSILNFNAMKSIITDCEDPSFRTIANPTQIKRKRHFQIVSEPAEKKFRFTYIKRVCLENNCTLPLGY